MSSPLRLDLNQWLQAYLLLVDATDEGKDAPLFRPLSAASRSRLSSRSLGPWTIRSMLKRRLSDAGLPLIPESPLSLIASSTRVTFGLAGSLHG